MSDLLPTFSIIVPTYNRPRGLKRCLQAIEALNYPRDLFEVIVVNDGGDQSLAEIVAEFEPRLFLRYVVQQNLGPAVARNHGARLANGRFLAFTDDDCAPASSWLQKLAVQLMAEPRKMAGGYTRNALHRNPFSITSQLLVDFLYHYYNQTESRARFFTSNNFAVAADLFWEVGGFEELMSLAAGEDRELCDRWLEHGLGMVFVRGAVIYHAHHLQLFSFWRQHFNYGRGAWLYRWLRSQRKDGVMHLESPTFYFKLISYPLTMAQDIRAFLLTAMLLFTQTANATGFLFQQFSRRSSKKKLPVREPVQ
ncbi:glycosyltransferase [Candidatus Leptofilum sp.]|uniref:glycosyltransferase n=1 Tax=Candidatus Leptofilum sp. TaxID=3241576 RepID=UPI003B5A6CDD